MAAAAYDLCPLGSLCERTTVWVPEKDRRDNVVYIDVSAVSSERLRIVQPQLLKADEAPSRARKIVRSGDTLFATIRPTLKRIALVPQELDGELASTAFCVIRPRADLLEPNFAYFAVQTDDFIEAVARHERGASYPAVRDKDVLSELIPVPSLNEQRKIAAILGTVQSAVEVEGELIRVTRELKQAALRQFFARGLRNERQRQTDLGSIPETWDVVPLGECCSVLNSSMSYTELIQRSEDAAGVICHGVKVSDMNREENAINFVTTNLSRKIPVKEAMRRTVPPGAIVFPKRGAAIATNKKRMSTQWTVLDPNLIAVRTSERLLPSFLFQWFQEFDLRTITEPGPTPQLNKKNLTPLLLPIPNHDEQRDIAAHLEVIDAKITSHEARQKLLRELFHTLLHDLMTAKRGVGDRDFGVLGI